MQPRSFGRACSQQNESLYHTLVIIFFFAIVHLFNDDCLSHGTGRGVDGGDDIV
jgi:hypothetical protein